MTEIEAIARAIFECRTSYTGSGTRARRWTWDDLDDASKEHQRTTARAVWKLIEPALAEARVTAYAAGKAAGLSNVPHAPVVSTRVARDTEPAVRFKPWVRDIIVKALNDTLARLMTDYIATPAQDEDKIADLGNDIGYLLAIIKTLAANSVPAMPSPTADTILFAILRERLPKFDPAWPEEWRQIWQQGFSTLLVLADTIPSAGVSVGPAPSSTVTQDSEIARLRGIVGVKVHCRACGTVVPYDKPDCDCISGGCPEKQKLGVYDEELYDALATQETELTALKVDIARTLEIASREATRADALAEKNRRLIEAIAAASECTRSFPALWERSETHIEIWQVAHGAGVLDAVTVLKGAALSETAANTKER